MSEPRSELEVDAPATCALSLLHSEVERTAALAAPRFAMLSAQGSANVAWALATVRCEASLVTGAARSPPRRQEVTASQSHSGVSGRWQ